jgi:SAM-dependent methyltransferase
MNYDPQGVRDYFNHYGTREWERLERSLQGRIKYAIHRRFLDQYLPECARVLDIGCGPGRYALDLARRGARLTLADISQAQLGQAEEHLKAAGLLDQVQAFHCLDMVDLGVFPDESFDAVVCYGAALSYTYDHYETALNELTRVLAPGGRMLVSVASLYGTLRLIGPYDGLSFLENADVHIEWGQVLAGAGIVFTRPKSPEFHQPFVLFSSAGLKQAFDKVGLRVVEMAAANPLVSEGAQIPKVTGSEEASSALVELELALCNQPGLVDTGEHLLAVGQKA